MSLHPSNWHEEGDYLIHTLPNGTQRAYKAKLTPYSHRNFGGPQNRLQPITNEGINAYEASLNLDVDRINRKSHVEEASDDIQAFLQKENQES